MSSQLLALTIVLFSPALLLCASNHLNLTIGLQCAVGKAGYCAEVYVYEHDMFTENDFLAARNVCLPTGKEPKSTFDVEFGSINLDDDWSKNFEIGVMVTHNCTHSGKTFCFKPFFKNPFELSSEKNHTMSFTLALDDTRNGKINRDGDCVHNPIP